MPLNGSINREIRIGLEFDSRSFTRDVIAASDSLKALEQGAVAAQAAVNRIQTPGQLPGQAAPETAAAFAAPADAAGGAAGEASTMAADIARIGPELSSSLQAGLKPLTEIGNVMQQQLNVIGGVVEQLAARIEGAMRMTGIQNALTAFQTRVQGAMATAAAAGEESMSRLQRATLALGPAALTAVGGFRAFLSIRGVLSTLGSSTDQTRLSLAKLNGISLATPIAGAGKLASQFRSVAPAVNTVTTSVKGLGAQIAVALGIVGLAYKATQALMGFFTTGIKGAINMNETLNKVNETFGESTKIVTAMADQMAAKFGLTKGPMLDAAASFGLIAQGAGLSEKAAAQMSVELTQLAVDTASFYHIPLEQALEKIKAGLSGESKPLRDLGVLMNEDAVKAKALALHLTTGNKALDEDAKVTARAALIKQGLATASGDMARTQEAVANQFLRAGGGITNFAGTIGGMLLPIVKTTITAFNELLASLITVFEENKPVIQTWVDVVKTGFDTLAMVLRNAGDYWTIFKLQTIENLSNVLAYVETIPANLGIMADYIQGNWKDMIFTGVDAVLTVFINLGKNIRELGSSIVKWLSDPLGGFTFNWTPLLEGFQSTVQELPALVKPELVSMQDEIAAAGQRIFNREQERARSIAAIAPAPRKPRPIEEKAAKPSEYKPVAAAELGTQEFGSAIARFYNQAGAADAKKTADNTGQLVKQQKTMVKALEEIRQRGGARTVGLAAFTI